MMRTPFDLIQALRSWFHAKDAAIFTGGRDIDTGGGDVIVGAGTVDGVDVGAHPGNANAHHNQSHVLATGTALGPDHTISGAADGEVLRATGSTAARFDQLSHADLGSVTANQHHNESHTVASHSDTTATGSELETLTNGSDASTLHDHDGRYYQESEFSANPGANTLPLKSDSGGMLRLIGLGIGTAATTSDVNIFKDLAVGEAATVGTTLTTTNSVIIEGGGVLQLAERGTPSTPGSGYLRLYAKTDGRLYYKNDGGTEYGPL
jgi:hypothetical protein